MKAARNDRETLSSLAYRAHARRGIVNPELAPGKSYKAYDAVHGQAELSAVSSRISTLEESGEQWRHRRLPRTDDAR
jgi:hypothetical protein